MRAGAPHQLCWRFHSWREARASMSVDWFAGDVRRPPASEHRRGEARCSPTWSADFRGVRRGRGRGSPAPRRPMSSESVARPTLRAIFAQRWRRECRRCSPPLTPPCTMVRPPMRRKRTGESTAHQESADRRGRCGLAAAGLNVAVLRVYGHRHARFLPRSSSLLAAVPSPSSAPSTEAAHEKRTKTRCA